MKPILIDKVTSKKNGYQSDDENVRYKINRKYFNKVGKSPTKAKKTEKIQSDDDDETVRYIFPKVLNKTKQMEPKPKPKPKIKVNFWSNKQVSRLHTHKDDNKQKTNRRHTVAATADDTITAKPKHTGVKVRKRVSFLPSPVFSDNHVPMVTVPDDLTIQLNEEEANDLANDLASANHHSNSNLHSSKRKRGDWINYKEAKRTKNSTEDSGTRTQANENELEFFSKYVVQKLRRMETNQRIYSENLINTVLMLGQLGKLNGKAKIAESS